MNAIARLRRLLRSRIFARALLAHVSATVTTVVLLALIFMWIGRNGFREQLRSRAEALADFAALESQFAMLVGDDVALERLASSVLANDDVLFVVLRSKGRSDVVALQPGIDRSKIGRAILTSLHTATGPVNIIDVRRSVVAPERALDDWQAQTQRADALGTVRIGFSMAKQDRLFVRAVASAASVAVLGLILVLTLQYFRMWRLLLPITELGDFAHRVGEGDLASRAPVRGEDEVASVARALNDMVERLGASMVSKSYVDDIIQSMAESLMVVDAHGRIRKANRATCQLLGYTEEELVGCAASEILHNDGQEHTYRNRSGMEIPVLFSEAELNGGAGRVWMAQDITALKRTQEQLLEAKEAAEEASRAKSLFLANMSHELRTPLNAIIGYAELINESAGESQDEQTRSDLNKIRSAGLHLRDLINDVLDMSKMEAGKITAYPTQFELRSVLESVVSTVRPLADQNRNEIELVVRGEAGVLHTDQVKFRQSLLNLMSNACKFTSDGKVSLEVQSDRRNSADWIHVSVRDTGLGIAPDKVSQLFRPFYQVDNSLTRKVGGTGLGLAITKNLCEILGGNVEVSSTPGSGSVFTMHLPAVLPSAEAGPN